MNETQQIPVGATPTSGATTNNNVPVGSGGKPQVEAVVNQTLEQGKNPLVLLVEDDPFLNSLLKTKLASQGVQVVLVTDGEAALQSMQTVKPNLVLLDLILPKKSGFEVLEAMQADPNLNKVPVIILSNLGQESDVAKGQQLGAVEYFVKAKTSIDELVVKVKGFL